MYNNPFYMPGYTRTFINPSIARGIPYISTNTARASNGILSRVIPSLSGIKKLNWGNLINNTSKTLGLINQTIPIVKQTGPMINNIKSMVRVASLFKDETDIKRSIKTNTNTNYNNSNNINQQNTTNNQQNKQLEKQKNNYKNQEYSESPTFFINT